MLRSEGQAGHAGTQLKHSGPEAQVEVERRLALEAEELATLLHSSRHSVASSGLQENAEKFRLEAQAVAS